MSCLRIALLLRILAVALFVIFLTACENEADFWGVVVIISIPIAIGAIIFCWVNGDAVEQRSREAHRWLKGNYRREEQKRLQAEEDRRLAEHRRRIADMTAPNVADLMMAFDGNNPMLAVDVWRKNPSLTINRIEGEMRKAKTARKRWMGKGVDAVLMKQWRQFLVETYEAAQDDYITSCADPPDPAVVALATSFNSNDYTGAIDAWRTAWRRRSVLFINVTEMMREMRKAEAARKRWVGKRVDVALKKQWRTFLEETFEAAQDDYFTNADSDATPKTTCSSSSTT